MSAAAAKLAPDPTIERLEEQIGWYDRKSRSNMRWFKRIKRVELLQDGRGTPYTADRP